MLQNKDLKKAYENALDCKTNINYIWFNSESKEPVKREIDITNDKILLYHYYDSIGDNNMEANMPGYDECPKTVKVMTIFVSPSQSSEITIETPKTDIEEPCT